MKSYLKLIFGIFLILGMLTQANFGFVPLKTTNDFNIGASIGQNTATIILYAIGFWLTISGYKGMKKYKSKKAIEEKKDE